MERTKGEWYLSEWPQEDGHFIYSKDFHEAAVLRCYTKNSTVKNGEEGKANAQFICTAVNNHDKLVEALTKIQSLYGDRNDYLEPYKTAREQVEQLLQSIKSK